MTKLIRAEDVKDLLMGLDELPWEENVGDLVDSLPTVDAVEVVHSYWDYDRIDAICHHCGFKWFDGCQECGVWPSEVNYCPNCGAKMDGDSDAT